MLEWVPWPEGQPWKTAAGAVLKKFVWLELGQDGKSLSSLRIVFGNEAVF